MRLTLPDGSVAEGNPTELADFLNLSKIHEPHTPNIESVIVPNSLATEDFRFVSESVAARALNRLKLSPAQVKMLRKLYESGDKWVLATELHRAVGYSASQFAGLMGAFGRRVVYTPGYVVDSSFFEIDWDYDINCYRYRLPASVRKAVEKLNLV
jgi:hypothetical protein